MSAFVQKWKFQGPQISSVNRGRKSEQNNLGGALRLVKHTMNRLPSNKGHNMNMTLLEMKALAHVCTRTRMMSFHGA